MAPMCGLLYMDIFHKCLITCFRKVPNSSFSFWKSYPKTTFCEVLYFRNVPENDTKFIIPKSTHIVKGISAPPSPWSSTLMWLRPDSQQFISCIYQLINHIPEQTINTSLKLLTLKQQRAACWDPSCVLPSPMTACRPQLELHYQVHRWYHSGWAN